MNTILCPTDFSACAANAIDYAYELAVLSHSRLILFHSLYDPDAVAGANPKSPLEEMLSQGRLDSIVHTLRQRKPQVPITYETRVSTSDTAFEIAHIADTKKADLVVMGTIGAHGLKEKTIGSTAADVVETSRHPVLVIPESCSFTPLKRIVFAADLVQEPSMDLSFVVDLARLFQAEIMFLHVLKEITYASKSIAAIEYHQIYAHIHYDKISFHTQEETDIERGILEFAKDTATDLLVMINRPKGFWEYLYNRSQTRKLAYHTSIPLLAIHS